MLIKENTIWTPDNSNLLKYTAEIEIGDIIAGQELYIELQRLVDDLDCNDDYFYDTSAADLRMDFMENCIRLTKSPYYGKPLKLMLWQKAFIETLYSFKLTKELKDNNRVIDRFKKSAFIDRP